MSENACQDQYGRVADDGTVYVITNSGERAVGQVPEATPEEAMAFFKRRFEWLEGHVMLVVQRVEAGTVSADEARKTIATLTEQIATANAVGNLDGLQAKLDALKPALEQMQEAKKAERVATNERTKTAKEQMIADAEKLAQGNDWRHGHNRFRELLEQWKKLPRIDRTTDDELWHRFSTARSAYDRRRKQTFSEQNEQRSAAKKLKEQILVEARSLATSTDWGQTTGSFRDLMGRWKAAGSAPRDVDEKLWQEFRGLQDQFFQAKLGTMAEQDAQFKGNQEAKEALLATAEKELLPVVDLAVAKKGLAAFLEQYSAIGKVPRDAIRPLDQRVRALTGAVADAEKAEWQRTDPEARKRAEDAVTMFESHIEKLKQQLAAAQAKGDTKKAKDTEQSMTTYQSWLDQARETLADFTR